MDYEALARQFGGTTQGAAPTPTPAAAPTAAPQQDMMALAAQFGGQVEQQPMGFFESIGEMVTGTRRATPETQTLPEWTGMPELNQLSVASLKSALGTLVTNPRETVQILQANFPGVQVRQDAKGNFILRSSVDQQEYAIPPGFSVGDIPRALGGLLAFTPAGRATTLPGAVAAGAGTQAVIEATQAGTGGRFDTGEVAIAGAGGGAGQVAQRAIQAGAPVVQRGVQRLTGRAPTPAAAPVAAAPAPVVAPAAPVVAAAPVEAAETVVRAADTAAPAAGMAQQVAGEAAEQVTTAGDVLTLARKASGVGPGSTAAKAKLVDLAQVNPEARAAAERLGMDLPFDVFSDNPQVRSAVGLTRALAAGEQEAAWEGAVRNVITRADDISQQFDAAFVEGRPATGVTSQRILDSLKGAQSDLKANAKTIYDRINGTDSTPGLIGKSQTAQLNNLQRVIGEVTQEVGESGMTAQEKRLAAVLAGEEPATYGRLLREKSLIGKALEGKDSPYSSVDAGTLKRLYGALAQDQLDTVEAVAGEAARRELRAANLLTTKQKALEKRIIGAFGKEIDGSVATLMQSAIRTASRGDAAQFNKLMKVVPPELKRETVATALASVTAGRGAGRAADAAEAVFSPNEFVKVYRGLRANPPVYAQVVEIMGKDWDKVARDLFEVSRRVTDAQARIPTTGKANQILGEMAVDGLMGKVMSSSIAQRAATGVAGTLPGGGLIAPDIVQWMSNAKGAGVQKAGELFASPEFQKLAVEAATQGGQASEQTLRQTATSKAFRDFANSINVPQSLDARVQWLQSAVQTGRQFEQENQ
jgi:hypothetical protein